MKEKFIYKIYYKQITSFPAEVEATSYEEARQKFDKMFPSDSFRTIIIDNITQWERSK